MFEVGALAKAMPDAYVKTRVVPVLIGTQPAGLIGTPLTHFQAVEAMTQSTMFRLLGEINGLLEKQLTETQLREAVETWWPKLSNRLKDVERAVKAEKVVAPLPAEAEILNQILTSLRSQERRLDTLSLEHFPMQQRVPVTSDPSERTREIGNAANEVAELLTDANYQVSYINSASDGDIFIGIDKDIDPDTQSQVNMIIRRAQGRLRGPGSRLRVVYTLHGPGDGEGGDAPDGKP